MDSHETFDPSKIAQAHKLLTGLDHDITKLVKMTSRIGARFEDYKNIYHDINPWLPILKESFKQNLEVLPPFVQLAKAHGLMHVPLANASVGSVAIIGSLVPRTGDRKGLYREFI